MIVEARHRIALATQAYDASAKLLLNRKDLALPVRVGLFNTTVTPSLFNSWIVGALGESMEPLEQRLLQTGPTAPESVHPRGAHLPSAAPSCPCGD